MYFAGHMAWGYLAGKATSKFLKLEVNVPLLFLLSVLPDVDILIDLEHRGPTHSLLVLTLVFTPLLVLFRTRCFPYFVSIIVHVLGDLITYEGAKALWPVSTSLYGLGIPGRSLTASSLEWTGFILSLIIICKNRDLQKLFQPHLSNLLLSPLVGGISLSIFLRRSLPIPAILLIPHFTYLIVFTISILRIFTASFLTQYTADV